MSSVQTAVNRAWAQLPPDEAVYQWLEAFGSRGATPREVSVLLMERDYPWPNERGSTTATTARVRLQLRRLAYNGRVRLSCDDPVRYAQVRP
jgi:hypothetical protein